MKAKLLLTKNEKSEIIKKVRAEDVVNFLHEIEEQTKWEIFRMINDIQSNIAKSYSVSRDNPKSSVFIYGRTSSISMTFRTREKEAKIMIPKDVIISPKN